MKERIFILKLYLFFQKFVSTLRNEYTDDDDKKYFYELLLRSQKLSERRGEGNIMENTDEGQIINAKGFAQNIFV